MSAKQMAACIMSGYRYEFTGKRNWRRSKAEKWDTRVGKVMCGKKVGTRMIDGTSMHVVKVRGKFYAATHVKKR
jgi:hypothetical protein